MAKAFAARLEPAGATGEIAAWSADRARQASRRVLKAWHGWRQTAPFW